MALVLNGKYAAKRDFYINRYLRLYPSYLIVLIASIGWYGVIAWRTHQMPPLYWIYQANHLMPWWQWCLLRASNLTMIGLDIPSLFHWSAQKGFLFLHFPGGNTAPDGAEWCGYLPWIRQGWSIGAELWFYMLAPFLVRRGWAVQAAILLLSLATKVLLDKSGFMTYYIFPANLWLFMTGSLLFACYPKIAGWGHRLAPAAVITVVLACLFGGLVANPIAHWAVLLFLIGSIPILFAGFSKSTWDNAIGELSYPVYLLHILVGGVLGIALHVHHPLVVAAVTVIFALGLVRFVEEPVNRYRQWRHRRAAGKTSTAAGALSNTEMPIREARARIIP